MSRGVRDLRHLISQSRQVHVDDNSEDERDNIGDIYCDCEATNALSKQIGQLESISLVYDHYSVICYDYKFSQHFML